ncbi:MAG: allophanate hydrolase [Gammaproteobacteria bacterium]
MQESTGLGLDLTTLTGGATTPSEIVRIVYRRIPERLSNPIWITLRPEEDVLGEALALEARGPDRGPLYGLPFAVKDNIDCAGLPTTAACPALTYTPAKSAHAVQRLLDAGALLIGKTNLDQLATGLTGTRSPYGVCRNLFDDRYIAGGSSSGSALSVAAGLVSFGLGTDTAGSGRVPAAFNNIVGLKATRGLVSTRGVVPACRSLDCVSVFALSSADALAVLRVLAGYDPEDPYSRTDASVNGLSAVPPAASFRFGVPSELEFFGDGEAERLFHAALRHLETLGGTAIEIDFSPYREAARLLYDGPWLAERFFAFAPLLARDPDALHPIVRAVVEPGARFTAAECFAAQHRLQALIQATRRDWAAMDLLVTPTAGTCYTRAAIDQEPIRRNTDLGYYTNFVNLMDLSALAMPAGFTGSGLPFGVSLVAPPFQEGFLCAVGHALHAAQGLTVGATRHRLPVGPATTPADGMAVRLCVCGAHMSGLPLNSELLRLGGRFLGPARTAPHYRLYCLDAFTPARPGLLRQEPGATIEVEVWELPIAAFGILVAGIPAPLAIGRVEIETGEAVAGFLCEAHATEGARDITSYGGWREYLAAAGGP